MTIGALLRCGRVIKRAGTLTRNARGLPVVVIVEPADPPVVVYVGVQMHLVATGAKLRGLFAHERFHEGSPVRFGIHINQKVMQRLDQLVLAGGELRKRGVLDRVVALSHRAVH